MIDPLYVNDDGDEVVTFAFAPTGRDRGEGRRMSDDVAIVGIGMHEFGRHDGVEGIDQGVVAVRRALRRRRRCSGTTSSSPSAAARRPARPTRWCPSSA